MGWTHKICDTCWAKTNPGRVATRVNPQYDELSPCCFCGKETASGIYIRHDPKLLKCNCK